VLQHPQTINQLRQICVREPVVQTTYVCELPPEPVTLIVRDDRNSLDMLESALEKNYCQQRGQQRGVQSLQFECKFDLSDGHQSLIVVPEASGKVPKKKAESQMWAAKCVAKCELLESKR
jgi:hypothetical protein